MKTKRGNEISMFKQVLRKLLRHWAEQKRIFILPAAFMILMMTMISFSQLAMEIHAYTFIVNKAVENRNIENWIKIKKVEENLKNIQSECNTKKVNNHKKSTDEKSVNVNNSIVKNSYAGTSVLSFVKPLKGGITSSLYGDMVSRTARHLGHDWAVEIGTKVVASAKGVVDKAYYSTSYGYNVLINHGNGIKTRYAHLSKISVETGQTVKANQAIGLSGNTGDSTGPHLHFEIIVNGECCNPLNYIQ